VEEEVKKLHVYASISELKDSLDTYFQKKLGNPNIGEEVKMHPRKVSKNSDEYVVTAKREFKELEETQTLDIGTIKFSLIKNEPKIISLIEISIYKPIDKLFFEEFGILRRLMFYFADKFGLPDENERPQIPFLDLDKFDFSQFVDIPKKELTSNEQLSPINPSEIDNKENNTQDTEFEHKDFEESNTLPERIFSSDLKDYLVLKNKEIMKQYYPSYNITYMISLIKITRKTYEAYLPRKKGRWGPGKFLISDLHAETISRYFGALYYLGVRWIDETPIPYKPRKKSLSRFCR
jgi:hypothetical protein